MASPQQEIIDKCKAVFALAQTLYNVNLEPLTVVRFNLRGRVAGYASTRGGRHSLRFNHDMLLRELDEIRDVVVPHEVAHLVCHARRELGANHDAGWARVCRALGGTGDRTHDMEIVYGNGRTYEYTTDRGHKVRMSERRHQHVQNGRSLTYRKGMGQVTKLCAYSIVGVAGRTLAQPVVRQAAALPGPVPQVALPAPVQRPLVIVPVPHVAPPVQRTIITGDSKAAVSRNIMSVGYRNSDSYETIISRMMTANGYNRQLARATFKANAHKVGIPSDFGI